MTNDNTANVVEYPQKELDPKTKSLNPWPTVLGILLLISLGLNTSLTLKVNSLQKQVQLISRMLNKPVEDVKPQFKMSIKITPKKVITPVKITPKKAVQDAKPSKIVKPVYKEYNPLISNDLIIASRMSEINNYLNAKLEYDYLKIEVKEIDRQLEYEKELVSNLNSDLSILLDAQPTINKFMTPPQVKTGFQKFKEHSKKMILPVALSILLRVIIH